MRKKQQGGVGSWIFIILVFGGVLSMGFKLVPLYMDHNTMASILDSLAEEEGLAGKSKSSIHETIGQRFKMNNIRDFPVKDEIEVARSGKGTELILDYEVRLPLIHNIDLIASFDKTVELRD